MACPLSGLRVTPSMLESILQDDQNGQSSSIVLEFFRAFLVARHICQPLHKDWADLTRER